MGQFVKPAGEESQDWVGVYRGPNNQWRCQHLRPDGRKCNRLLAVEENGFLYSKRGDHKVKCIDYGGSATGIQCTECYRWNWILSDQLTEVQLEDLRTRIGH